MEAKDLFAVGQLTEAIAAAAAAVKKHPGEVPRRTFLSELLCFAGDFDRADKHLDAVGLQDPAIALNITMFRQLMRGELARKQVFEEGRLPEFVGLPSDELKLRLEALVQCRVRRHDEAARLLEQAEAQRPRVGGVADGAPFDDLRDLDDLTSSFLETVTANGKYYWIPLDRVQKLEFRKPERTRDLLWRSVHMVVRDGPDAEVFLPVLYAGSYAEPDERIRLGRCTEWRGQEGQPVRGVGQKMFLVGEEGKPIMEFKEITFKAAGGGS